MPSPSLVAGIVGMLCMWQAAGGLSPRPRTCSTTTTPRLRAVPSTHTPCPRSSAQPRCNWLAALGCTPQRVPTQRRLFRRPRSCSTAIVPRPCAVLSTHTPARRAPAPPRCNWMAKRGCSPQPARLRRRVPRRHLTCAPAKDRGLQALRKQLLPQLAACAEAAPEAQVAARCSRRDGTRCQRALRRREIRSVLSQNCRGLKTDGRVTELVDAADCKHAFAACLQETWRPGDEEFTESSWTFLGSAPALQAGRGSAGVGILLSPSATAA